MCAGGALFVTFMLLDSHNRQGMAKTSLAPCSRAVRRFGLTDLCLFTEARYTRNPAVADFHAAFQDHPMALEHFPSGSFVPPPRRPESGAP